jgi:hypothetical protein
MWKRFLGALIEGCAAADPVVYIHYLATKRGAQAYTEEGRQLPSAIDGDYLLAESSGVRARVLA